MKPVTRILALLTITLSVAGTALAAGSGPGLLDKAKQSASEAAQWTKKKTDKGLEATKKGLGKAADWTADKAEKGMDATSKGAGKAADWTEDKAKKAEKKTRSLWERTKAWFKGDNDDN